MIRRKWTDTINLRHSRLIKLHNKSSKLIFRADLERKYGNVVGRIDYGLTWYAKKENLKYFDINRH